MTDQFSAADMATAASEGFRAGQGSIQTVADGRWYMVNRDGMATLCASKADAEKEAADAQRFWPHMGPHRAVQLVEVASIAASTGSEPVAHLWQHSETGRTRVVMPDAVVDADASWQVVGPLYLGAAPPTAQAEGWTKLPGQLPEPGMPVLLDIGKKYPIRAMWAAKHTVQAADDDTDWGEYVEADDMYYAPEGWYEWNQCEDNHWRVTETPRAWMPLPPTSAEGVEHG